MAKALIIGYGNVLRRDDGVGSHAAHRLAAMMDDADVEVVEAQQLTPEMAEPVSRADVVIFIDAACGTPAGKVEYHAVEPAAAAGSAFTHHTDPAGILQAASALYGRSPQAVAITVTGRSFEMGEGLSDEVAGAVAEVLGIVERIIAGGPLA